MGTWVAEVGERPTVVFFAASVELAEDLVADLDFRGELLLLVDDEHEPLWDGDAEISVRPATAEETETWDALLEEAVEDEEFADRNEALEAGFAAYLFPVHEAH